jgi:hypothetical protein
MTAAAERTQAAIVFGVLNLVAHSSYYRTEKPDYGRHLQFQTRVRSEDRVESPNDQPVADATDTTEDLDRNELNQLVSRLLDFRDADHSEPTSCRPRWSLRRQLRGNSRWHWRYFSGHGFPCRRLSPLEVLRRRSASLSVRRQSAR